MPRVTHVKRAQQRYATKPVLDENNEPKRTPVMRNGEQRTTKKGKPIFMAVTERDLSRPLPLLKCDFGGCDINGGLIAIGTPYKHITPKSGPYGGRQRNRHEEHRSWYQWEYSSSLSARLAQISHDFWEEVSGAESVDDVEGALESAASEIESLAEEKRDGASNIEDGFGHETSASQELNEIADQLDDWAQEVRDADVPEYPEPEEDDCPECGGSGQVDNPKEAAGELEGVPEQIDCDECDGTGQVLPEEPTEDQISTWHDEVQDACSIVDESPV